MPPAEAPHHPSVYFNEYEFVLKEQRQSFYYFLDVMTRWLSSAVSHFTCFLPVVLLHVEYARGNVSNKSVMTVTAGYPDGGLSLSFLVSSFEHQGSTF